MTGTLKWPVSIYGAGSEVKKAHGLRAVWVPFRTRHYFWRRSNVYSMKKIAQTFILILCMSLMILKGIDAIAAISGGPGAPWGAGSKKYMLARDTLHEMETAYNDKQIEKIIGLVKFSEKDKEIFRQSLVGSTGMDKTKEWNLRISIKDHSQFLNKVYIKVDWKKIYWEKLLPESSFGMDKVLDEGQAEFVFIVSESAKLSVIKGKSPF